MSEKSPVSLKVKARKLKNMLMLSQLSPLPIYDVGQETEPEEKATGAFGYVFPHIDHATIEPQDGDTSKCYLGCPVRSRRMANIMAELEARFWKKVNAQATQALVYQRPSIETPSKDFIPSHTDETCLRFNSWFESGNLDCAYRIYNRNYSSYMPLCTKHLQLSHSKRLPSNRRSSIQIDPEFLPMTVDQEYDLFCDCDTYTYGHVQWYYFQVKVKIPQGQSSLLVRFNIRNMIKRDSLYNEGMLPTVYSEVLAAQGIKGWTHAGEEAFYYENSDDLMRAQRRHHYTLSFVYKFHAHLSDSDTVYFAHCFPYTYTNLQTYMGSLVACPTRGPNIRRRTLCTTLCGNACDVLTITEYSAEPQVLMMRTGVVLTARVHPGETNGSFVMQGIIDFLTGPSTEAKRLRQCFVFKIIPMLNPDGVIHGNYRCSLAGVDLNRRWSNPSPTNHPTIYAAKRMIAAMRNSRRVILFCDIHGHSRKKNMFLYGCKPFSTWSQFEAARVRLFPYLLSKISSADQGGYFSFTDCTFNVARAKRSTGRVAIWNDVRILNSFTLETSFCGTGENKSKRFPTTQRRTTIADNTHYMIHDLFQSGEKFCCGLAAYSRLLGIQPIDDSSIPPPEAVLPSQTDDSTSQKDGNCPVQPTDNNSDFILSPEAIEVLEEITTVTPLSEDIDDDESGSDSNPSEDNMDPDELKQNTKWLSLMTHPRCQRTCVPSTEFDETPQLNPVLHPPFRRPTKSFLKSISNTNSRPSTVPTMESPPAIKALDVLKPARFSPQKVKEPIPDALALPSRRLSTSSLQIPKPSNANTAIAGLHRQLIKRRISIKSELQIQE
ncbi:hypothetical protein AeRB84_010368 [Aphanomyces euteiches]|nr:hypothetical protein AeRB84_010368 [Aphanomyces euteiches]